jgi:aryl-alcohol dehydrogenase-like predicted oxidoreductase
MWQVAGGHGKIDQKKAVEEMKRYAFAGLGVFDLADIYGPAEEIYGKFLREYLGANLVLGFTKFVPRYGKALFLSSAYS